MTFNVSIRGGKFIYLFNDFFQPYLSANLRNKPIADITEEDVRKWLVQDFLKRNPKEDALRKIIMFLNQVFRHGMKNHLCMINPAEYITATDYLKNCDVARKTDEEKAFSEAELDILGKDALKNSQNPRALMCLMAKETGLRAAELSGLHVSDVNDGFLHVHRQILINTDTKPSKYYEVGYTKDEVRHPKGGRYVPITTECESVIQLAASLPGTSEYIFHDETGKFVTPGSYELNLRKRCRRLGFKTTNNHAFRVAFNSRLIQLGFSASDRAMILGHEVETNERHYSVTDKRRLAKLAEIIKDGKPL